MACCSRCAGDLFLKSLKRLRQQWACDIMRGPVLPVDVDVILDQENSKNHPKMDLEIGPPIYNLNEGMDKPAAAHADSSLGESKQAKDESAAGDESLAGRSESAQADRPRLELEMDPHITDLSESTDERAAEHRASNLGQPEQAQDESSAAAGDSAADSSSRADRAEDAGVAYAREGVGLAAGVKGAHVESANGVAEGRGRAGHNVSNGSKEQGVENAGTAGQHSQAAEDHSVRS